MGLLSQIFPAHTGHGSDGTPLPAPHLQLDANAPPPPPAPTAAPAPTPAPGPGSQLDSFTKLWQTPTDKDGKPIVHANPLATPVLNFDPAKIAESAAQLDFTGKIDPALAAKALAGDATALSAYVNAAVQAAVVGIVTSQGQVINGALNENNQRLLSTLPTQVKRVQLESQPVDNPILEHPSVAPLMHALKLSEFNKNPNARPEDVHATVVGYLKGLAQAMTEGDPAAVAAAAKEKAGEPDWLKWANS